VPSLRTLSGRQIRAILEANGFYFVSQKGSHMKMRFTIENEDKTTTTYTAIVPDHKDVPIGTLQNIIRQSGLGRGPFEA